MTKKRRGRPVKTEFCAVEGCGKKHYARGLCRTHYNHEHHGARVAGRVRKSGEKTKYEIENADFLKQRDKTHERIEVLKEVARGQKGLAWCIDTIRKIHPDKLDRLVLFLTKKAEIVTKEEFKQIQETKQWLGKIVQKVHGYWTDVMDNPGASDTLKFNVSKEILSRIVPPKQEIDIHDSKRDVPTDDLLKQSLKLVLMIDRHKPKEEVSFERREAGRPKVSEDRG
jgi:hypothetical protein